jgi:hypothetical protein
MPPVHSSFILSRDEAELAKKVDKTWMEEINKWSLSDNFQKAKKSKINSDDEVIEDKIKRDIDAPCRCGRKCLTRLKPHRNNYETAVEIVKECRLPILQRGFNTLSEQKDALRSKFNSTITGYDSKGRASHHFSVGEGDEKVDDICRQAWARAHGVTLSALDTLSKHAKQGKS